MHLERAAMIYFGVPSYGVHLNGYVKETGEIVLRYILRERLEYGFPNERNLGRVFTVPTKTRRGVRKQKSYHRHGSCCCAISLAGQASAGAIIKE